VVGRVVPPRRKSSAIRSNRVWPAALYISSSTEARIAISLIAAIFSTSLIVGFLDRLLIVLDVFDLGKQPPDSSFD